MPVSSLLIRDQVLLVLQHKQWRDIFEAWRRQQRCGCAECLRSYRDLREFYSLFGAHTPLQEHIRPLWYEEPFGHRAS